MNRKHFHDPFRPHAARPVSEDPGPVATAGPTPAPAPAEEEVVASDDGVTEVEPVIEEASAEAAPAPVEEEPVPEPAAITPPPQVGPGSSADAWRAYAAEVTSTPAETWADTTRAAIIEVLREQGYAVDQSGVQGS